MSESNDRSVHPGPVLALDLGERRIGVAISDSRRILARPYAVLDRTTAADGDLAAIRTLLEESGATEVVVGMPLLLSGRAGPAAERARREIEQLREGLPVPVHAYDERLSTVEATRRIAAAAREQKSRRSPATRRRAVVDDKAAAIILESYLDGARRTR